MMTIDVCIRKSIYQNQIYPKNSMFSLEKDTSKQNHSAQNDVCLCVETSDVIELETFSGHEIINKLDYSVARKRKRIPPPGYTPTPPPHTHTHTHKHITHNGIKCRAVMMVQSITQSILFRKIQITKSKSKLLY